MGKRFFSAGILFAFLLAASAPRSCLAEGTDLSSLIPAIPSVISPARDIARAASAVKSALEPRIASVGIGAGRFLSQSLRGPVNFLKYIGDTHDGINIWKQDTVLGAAQWMVDTSQGITRYAGNSRLMFSGGKGDIGSWISYTGDSLSGWTADSAARGDCLLRDAGERLSEWRSDNPFSEDYVDRKIRELKLTQVPKPQVTRALHDMGMFDCENRLYSSDLRKAIISRITPLDKSKPLAVIIQSKSDHSGSYTTDDVKSGLHEIFSSGERIYYAQADTDIKFQYILNRATENGAVPASLIYIAGHGNKMGVTLREQTPSDQVDFLDAYNDLEKISFLRNRLIPGGAVVLSSCYVGQGASGSDNVVNMLSKVFPQAGMVVGATDKISLARLNFSQQANVSGVKYFYTPDDSPTALRISSYDGISKEVSY